MAVRQRTWTWKGRERTAWVVDYFDFKGKPRLKTLRTKRAAQDWAVGTRVDLKHGTHVADAPGPSQSRPPADCGSLAAKRTA
jgi:integrase